METTVIKTPIERYLVEDEKLNFVIGNIEKIIDHAILSGRYTKSQFTFPDDITSTVYLTSFDKDSITIEFTGFTPQMLEIRKMFLGIRDRYITSGYKDVKKEVISYFSHPNNTKLTFFF